MIGSSWKMLENGWKLLENVISTWKWKIIGKCWEMETAEKCWKMLVGNGKQGEVVGKWQEILQQENVGNRKMLEVVEKLV